MDVLGELGALTAENTRRIKEQNKRKISVVIGKRANKRHEGALP